MVDKGHKGKQGFASMDPEKAREIRSLGGQTAQRLGKAHRLTHEEVRKGGKTSQANLRRQRAKVKDQNRKEQ
jgi:general stress protein YciG